MVLLKQSYSFSSQADPLSSSQYVQNSDSNVEDGIRRVTVRQLLDAVPRDDPKMRFQISGIGVKKVMLVANVHSDKLRSVAGQKYDINDGTGRIVGLGRDQGLEPIESFGYARVVGELDQYNGSKSFKVINIQPICDPHEVYYHILHAIVDTLTYERGPPPLYILPPASLPDDVSTNGIQLESAISAFGLVSVSDQETRPSPPTPTINTIVPDTNYNFSRLDRDVYDCLLDPYLLRENGVHIDDIVECIKTRHLNITIKELSDSIEFLLGRRKCSTIDDLHYRLIP